MPVIKRKIPKPVPVNSTARINFVVFADDRETTRLDLTGRTVTGQVKDPTSGWHTYLAALDDAPNGEAHITLVAANHQTPDQEAELRVEVDGELCHPLHRFDFIEEAA